MNPTPPTATQINLLHVCHRQLWLHSQEIRMEHNSDMVQEGKLIGERTYERRPSAYKEVNLGHIKIDHFDARNGIVKEVKKSNRLEAAYVAQVRYYIHELEKHGYSGLSGRIEYPKQRRTVSVVFLPEHRKEVRAWVAEIRRILAGSCPPLVKKPYCRTCSYREFCYV